MYDSNIKQVIVTAQSAASVIALNEIKKVSPEASLVEKFTFTEQLINIPLGFKDFIEPFKNSGSIFIRHMFPIMYTGGYPDDFSGGVCEKICSSLILTLENLMDKGLPFAIQARSSYVPNIDKNIILQLEKYFIENGFLQANKNPLQVISIYKHKNTLYAGLSHTGDNISKYNGGMHRFKKDEGLISRAEFKLLEAVNGLGITLPSSGQALDLGAAPGGFCRVLLEKGLDVTAVDPAGLDPRLKAYGNRLKHFKGLAEHFAAPPEKFDLITNDMRMDYISSAKLMIGMKKFLKSGGYIIMTLKLSNGNWLKKANIALNMLKRHYTIKAAKQLFNNRYEVTVWLSKD